MTTSDYALLEIRTTVLDDNNDEQPVIFDLLSGADGFIFDEWTPSVAQYKDDGVFQDSPFADGRKLVFRRFANAVETIKLKQHSDTTDGSASAGQDLVRLLEKAADYRPAGFSSFPVYIAFLPRKQTEIQYALIVAGKIPELQDPMSNPFFSRFGIKQNSVWEISLILEREHWTENPPEIGTAVPIHATQEFDGIVYGNVDSSEVVEPVTTPDVFMANQHVYSNITNMHITTTSGNIMGATPPYPIISVAVFTYFGVDSSVAGSCPFRSLIFDIGTVLTGGGVSLDFEYWNGAWVDLTVKDNTESFGELGVNGCYWTPPSDWVVNSPGGGLPPGWWIRVAAVGTVTQVPQQQNRNVYTVSWPYINIDKNLIGGEIPALMRASVYEGSPAMFLTPREEEAVNWVMLATRRTDRGEAFTPYANITNVAEDRPLGSTISVSGLSSDTINNSPTGRSYSWTPASTLELSLVTKLNYKFVGTSPTSNIAKQWAGRFRVFLRVIQENGSAGDLFVKLLFQTDSVGTSSVGEVFAEFNQLSTTVTDKLEAFDFGEVTIKENMSGFWVTIQLGKIATGISSHVLHLCDVVLMPVDEYSTIIDAQGGLFDNFSLFGGNGFLSNPSTRLELDGITQNNETRTIINTTESTVFYPLSIVSGRHRLTHKHQLRMWSFMQFGSISGAAVTTRAKLEKNQQYLTYRGKE